MGPCRTIQNSTLPHPIVRLIKHLRLSGVIGIFRDVWPSIVTGCISLAVFVGVALPAHPQYIHLHHLLNAVLHN